jgi:hypothetical protein
MDEDGVKIKNGVKKLKMVVTSLTVIDVLSHHPFNFFVKKLIEMLSLWSRMGRKRPTLWYKFHNYRLQRDTVIHLLSHHPFKLFLIEIVRNAMVT